VGWTSQVIVAQQVIIEGPGDSLLVYNGTAAAGTLITSIAPPSLTADSFGNAIIGGGLTSYTNVGGAYVATTISGAGQLTWSVAATYAGPYSQTGQVAGDVNGDLIMSCTNRIGVANPVLAFPGGGFESWHSLGAVAATGYTSNLANYRITNDDETEFDIELTANAGGGTAGNYAYANALPSSPVNYRPLTARSFPLGYNGTVTAGQNNPCLRVSTAGVVQITLPALPANTVLSAAVRMPLT